jgi:hypothetical protein
MSTEPEVAELLGRLRIAVNDNHQRRRRHRVAALVAGSFMVVAGVAVAAATQAPWWEGGAPPANPSVVDRQLKDGELPALADRSRARTVAQIDGAALVAVPIGDTGICLIPSLEGSPDIGFSCGYALHSPRPGEDDELRTYARPPSRGAPRWIVYGRVTDEGAAELDLGAFRAPVQPGGFVLANVPQGQWAQLANTANKGRILSAAGATLGAGCVDWGPSPDSAGAGSTRWGLWSVAREPCRPRPRLIGPPILDRSKAEKLVELTLTADFSIWKAGTTIALWKVPAKGGWECVFEGSLFPAEWPSGGPPGAGGCRAPGQQPAPPSDHAFESTSFAGGPAGVISGHVNPASGIARVELHEASGSQTLPFANGYFLGQLPPGGKMGELPPGGPFTVVGYDAAGKEVASYELRILRPPVTP